MRQVYTQLIINLQNAPRSRISGQLFHVLPQITKAGLVTKYGFDSSANTNKIIARKAWIFNRLNDKISISCCLPIKFACRSYQTKAATSTNPIGYQKCGGCLFSICVSPFLIRVCSWPKATRQDSWQTRRPIGLWMQTCNTPGDRLWNLNTTRQQLQPKSG